MITVDINSIYWQCFFPQWQPWVTNKPSALDIQQASGKESLLQTKTSAETWTSNLSKLPTPLQVLPNPWEGNQRTAWESQLACVSQRLALELKTLGFGMCGVATPLTLKAPVFFQNEEVGRTILCVETMMFIMPVVISQGRRRKHASWSQSTPSAGHPKKKLIFHYQM